MIFIIFSALFRCDHFGAELKLNRLHLQDSHLSHRVFISVMGKSTRIQNPEPNIMILLNLTPQKAPHLSNLTAFAHRWFILLLFNRALFQSNFKAVKMCSFSVKIQAV